MSAIETTAYTVRDPGNGERRRYGGEHWLLEISRAERVWSDLVESYPHLTKAIVPDHFVQEYCTVATSPMAAPVEIMLMLLEKAAEQGHTNFLNGKV